MESSSWKPDVLGDDYEAAEIALGEDPDGSALVATVVRHRSGLAPGRAVLWVHGFNDYFFQRHVAEHLAAHGVTLYAVDLRRCGRSLRPGQRPHYSADLTEYDADLDAALATVRADGHDRVVLCAHSTGGLVVPLWLDRRRGHGVAGVVLNSPWFDVAGGWVIRSLLPPLVRGVARVRPLWKLPLPDNSVYGRSVHAPSGDGGEWDFDVALKKVHGPIISAGWITAVRRGHARLHRGLDVGTPALVMHAGRSLPGARKLTPEARTSDVVLDVADMVRWAPSLGDDVKVVGFEDGIHDLTLSAGPVRARVLATITGWLDERVP